MKGKRSNYAGVIALLLAGAVGVYAIGVYIKKTPDAENVPPAIHRMNTTANPGDKATPSTEGQQSSVTIVTPHSAKGELSLPTKDVEVPQGQDPILFAVNGFFAGSHITPPEAKALGVEVKDGVALIDCTEAMEKSYGSSDEQAIIQGLRKTLAQFPSVQKVQLFVSGRA